MSNTPTNPPAYQETKLDAAYLQTLRMILGSLFDSLHTKSDFVYMLHKLGLNTDEYHHAIAWTDLILDAAKNQALARKLERIQPKAAPSVLQEEIASASAPALHDEVLRLIEERMDLWVKDAEARTLSDTATTPAVVFRTSIDLSKGVWNDYFVNMAIRDTVPKPEHMQRVCVGLRLNLWEAVALMGMAGYDPMVNYYSRGASMRMRKLLTLRNRTPYTAATNRELMQWTFEGVDVECLSTVIKSEASKR